VASSHIDKGYTILRFVGIDIGRGGGGRLTLCTEPYFPNFQESASVWFERTWTRSIFHWLGTLFHWQKLPKMEIQAAYLQPSFSFRIRPLLKLEVLEYRRQRHPNTTTLIAGNPLSYEPSFPWSSPAAAQTAPSPQPG